MIQIRRKGFTLVEMLTVLAVTAILLTIITVPIFQSFSLVRAAEAFADAQDQGRFGVRSRKPASADDVKRG